MSLIRNMNFCQAWRSGFFIILLSLNFRVALGQSIPASQYGLDKYTAITADDGLPSNFVTSVLVDKRGFLWIGTNAGLARYDGTIMRVFDFDPQNQTSLPGPEITDIAMDDEGKIWVGTAAHGLCRFEEETGTFKRYGVFRKELQKGQPSERIMQISNGASGLWVCVENYGAGRYVKEQDEFETFAVPGHEESYTNRQRRIIASILPDPNDNDLVWMPSYDGLWKLKISTREWVMYDDSPTHKPEKANDRRSFRGASFHLDGKIYISIFRGGILSFDPSAQKWDSFSEQKFNPQLLRENNYQDVLPRDSTTLWLVSNTRGIAVLDLQSGIIRTIGACSGEVGPGDLCSVYANDFWVDEAGNAILATNKGLRIYTGKTQIFKQIDIPISTPHLVGRYNVNTIFPIEGNKILSGGYAGEGLYLTDLQTAKTKLIVPPKGHRVGDVREMLWVTHIVPYRQNELIVVSAFEIFIFNTQTETLSVASTNLKDFENRGYYGRCYKHSDGMYYLATRYNGVFVLDEELQVVKNLVHNPEEPNSLNSSNYIFDFDTDPDGNLWIGSEKGFTIYNSENEIFQNSNREIRKDSMATFKLALRVTINPIDSTAWILDNRHGIGILPHPYDKHLSNIKVLDASNGLLENKAHGIYHFKNGETYVITSGGLTHISHDGHKFSFPRELGFPETRTFSPMAFDSVFWIGTAEKLFYFHPDEIKRKNDDVEMYLSSIRIFQNELDIGRAYQNLDELKLTYRQNFMSIQVGLINLFNPGVFNLSYRLKGFDNQWVEAGLNQNAIFTNVPGGKYIFEARITDPNGHLSGKMITLPVEIIPPFWERWWFIAGCILFIISIAALIYTVHARSIRREERLKSEFEKKLAGTELAALRAQINPHFLFNSINGIRHEIMQGRLLKAEAHLIKFSKLVRIILENVSYHIIPLQEELDSLQLYIDLESLRFDNQFIFKIEKNADIDLDQTFIPPMLIQPFVENAIWHGLHQKEGRGTVIVALEKAANKLFITITDNGIGREQALKLQSKSALKKKSLGMEITGNRLEIIEKIYNISCSAEIVDLKSEEGVPTGTKVLITLPLFHKHENRDIG